MAVVGAGNTAMDVARTAFRPGTGEVTPYARSRHISASSDELGHALLDGCELVRGKAVCEVNAAGPVFRAVVLDGDVKVVGYEGELGQVGATRRSWPSCRGRGTSSSSPTGT